MPAAPTVVLDCRWLGIAGAGRTTELVLRGLAERPPAGRWVLWGDEAAVRPYAWPGTEIEHNADDPRLLLGQRHAFKVPKGDLVVFMHQTRPLRDVPSITMIYDTIPLRFGTNRPVRGVKRAFLRRVAHTSRRILTVSEHSKASVVRDLAADPGRIEVLRFPFDGEFVGRVQELRTLTSRSNTALFVGSFLPHKNLPRLLRAFDATDFRRDGGRLVLAGGTAAQAEKLRRGMTHRQREVVSVTSVRGQGALDRLFASSLFLVQPSLEEGFGLPAWEAVCCGLPVCASDGGALPEVVAGFARPFDATSDSAMSSAIDICAASAQGWTAEDACRQAEDVQHSSSCIRDFGDRFRSIVEHNAVAVAPR